jgi:ATP-dependent Lhr-like helicase
MAFPVDFDPLISEWFESRFAGATEPQLQGWPEIRAGRDVLISAPTGSGKTLAAFLLCLDRLVGQARAGSLPDETEVLYVSPLKALSNDIHKNLEVPLAEISNLATARGVDLQEIRTALRTGDTPAWERQQMIRTPAHILVTTPESLFILLTAERSRQMLRTVRTVIADEIHAVADDKRGAHFALSLARLDALVQSAGRPAPQRIGLSATVKPIEEIALFLAGSSDPVRADAALKPVSIVDVGHRREMDLAVEVPKDELGPVASNEMWAEIYDRVAGLIRENRTTLVFVNTRRLAERVAHHLGERLGEGAVLPHHGSLSRALRLDAEGRLKRGELRAVVATASLELGIDIGTVDLVVQIGSPRSIAVALQRIGRSGHWVGARPKGRLIATTRDELIECAALVRGIRTGELDRTQIPDAPLDVLAQQIVAAAAAGEWTEDDLFALARGTYSYRGLKQKDFDAIIEMLSDGIASARGRSGAYLHRDQVNHRVRGRRGARLAAITSGGAIPDSANYLVIAEPEGTVIGSLDEDFAVESLAGDVFLLGTTSWRIRRVEPGRVRVEDAHGAPPSIPFWRGEAPGRTAELSAEVSRVREQIVHLSRRDSGSYSEPAPAQAVQPNGNQSADEQTRPVVHPEAVEFLQAECGLDRRGAEQAVDYVLAGAASLGALPTTHTVIAERFFDEAGGMQLILHAPFGARINRAWGLALRKRFCRTFNFELQAAATDNGIVISLGEQHAFPLEIVFGFLNRATVEPVLTQALLAAPMFTARWRWNASRALAILRFRAGAKVPPPIQRMRADDLMAAVFPDQAACGENLAGDIRIPDHPLVKETIGDCLREAMDLEGLMELLRRIETGELRTVAVDTAEPSPFSHEILNANPYAYLDDAPLEERRARAVQLRRTLRTDVADGIGALDEEAIAQVAEESWPVVRDSDELHDALLTLVTLPPEAEWEPFFAVLQATGRATMLEAAQGTFWVPAERLEIARFVHRDAVLNPPLTPVSSGRALPEEQDACAASILLGWFESTGPQTASALASRLGMSVDLVQQALARLEGEGQILRGRFTPGDTGEEIEWCHRRLLARIHRLTLGRLRREIEPVTTAQFMRFLSRWQHVASGTQLHGPDGTLQIIRQLQGYEISAAGWESDILPRRIARYQPEFLDELCLSGEVMWGRLSPHPAFETEDGGRRRIRPTRVAPIAIFLREGFDPPAAPAGDAPLSHPAREVLAELERRGASFFVELVRATGRLASEVEDALWELVAAGLVTADGFDNLRSLVDPKRRRGEASGRRSRPRHAPGRWALLPRRVHSDSETPARAEAFGRQLLSRWGVVFRDLLARETLAPAWRDLLVALRRLEDRGEIRGGRFVSGFAGEQFALPEAIELLRSVRRESASGEEVRISTADPLNLGGILLPGPRISALSGDSILLRNGLPVAAEELHYAG